MVQYKTGQIDYPKYNDKIDFFLKEFVKELIFNSGNKKKVRQKFEFMSMIKENEDNDPNYKPINLLPPISVLKSKSIMLPNANLSLKPQILQNQSLVNEQDVEGFYLKRIQSLVNDKDVVSIECPGPGRFINVKKRGKRMITKLTLTSQDIDFIINKFSEQTNIPRIGGIFKAIVDNLIITAIDSDVVGPKFIITKIIQRDSVYF
ncbi:MAG TPA: hypothetical protein P5277_00430 [Candidatus Paceibacterota bacterium]|nr:hypothetical protein [Candidatus Paceibacterota bacterium]